MDETVGVAYLVRAFAAHAGDWDWRPDTETRSDSSIGKRTATGVNVTGPRR